MRTVLLCTDLDRTVLPNGKEPESADARQRFARLVAHEQVRLAYVSGRHKSLIEDAIREYEIPVPDFLIGDVGTTIYKRAQRTWVLDPGWQTVIGQDWQGMQHNDIVDLLARELGHHTLQLQPKEKQNTFKISYFTVSGVDVSSLKSDVSRILEKHNLRANLIWSLDEPENVGLFDILPWRANKLEAIRFLMRDENIREESTVFAGDSGNDLDVLVSELQAIVVKNGAEDVKAEAISRLGKRDPASTLYLARGNVLGMNGNYSAGVVEGFLHYFPEFYSWMLAEKQ